MKSLAVFYVRKSKAFYINIEKALTAFNGTKITKSKYLFIQREEIKLRTSTWLQIVVTGSRLFHSCYAYETVHLSPPSGGGPDSAICFSIFSFFFLFSSTDRTSRMPRDAASFCLLSAASASFALFSSRAGDGGADSPGHGKHSPMGTAAGGPRARPDPTRPDPTRRVPRF